MAGLDPGEADRRFEQDLLETARLDAAPKSAEQAWSDFSRAIQVAAANIEPGSGVHRIEPPQGVAPSQVEARALGYHAGFGKALLWLVLGALGGSAITGSILSRHQKSAKAILARESTRAPAIVSVYPTASGEAAKDSTTVRASEQPTAVATTRRHTTTLEPSLTARPISSFVRGQPESESSTETQGPRSSSMSAGDGSPSALALEVKELDSIRRASRSGIYAEVIRRVDRFHREFPRGVLAPDADVLALEALAARHEYTSLAERTAAFLVKYPTDPHAAKVRRLAEIAAQHNPQP